VRGRPFWSADITHPPRRHRLAKCTQACSCVRRWKSHRRSAVPAGRFSGIHLDTVRAVHVSDGPATPLKAKLAVDFRDIGKAQDNIGWVSPTQEQGRAVKGDTLTFTHEKTIPRSHRGNMARFSLMPVLGQGHGYLGQTTTLPKKREKDKGKEGENRRKEIKKEEK